MDTREVMIAHDPARGPMTAVRRMLVQSSIAELLELDLFERYRALIAPATLTIINESIGPGWLPVQLAVEHYSACDKLGLSKDQIYKAGLRAGAKMGDALLIAGSQLEHGAHGFPWTIFKAFSRMGRRLYEGSSSQYVKLAPNKLLIEHRGNPLYQFDYYRIAHGGFMHKTFVSVGIELTDFKLSPYRREGAQIDARLSWK